MKNKYFPEEQIEENDLYFVCYMIERVARHLKQKNQYVVNAIGKEELYHLLSCANVLHCENPLKVEEDWINDYHLVSGDVDVTDVDKIIKVYNNPICDVIDNYNCSAFYEPSYVIARAYQNGGF